MSTLQSRKTSWVSPWHALFHTAKDGDILGTPQGFQKSRPAKICNTSVKSSLLVFLQNPANFVSKRWQPKIAPALFQSERFPPELILEISKYLSLSSALSLSYTCRRFRQTVDAKLEDLDYLIDMQSFLKDPKESQGQRKIVLERLAFLCLLERDGRLSASKAVCGGCKTTHNNSLFSSTALQKRPHQRLCMGREGRLWICPHRIWDHAQLREVQKQGGKATGSAALCGCPNGEVFFDHQSINSPPTATYSLSIYYPVLAMPQGSVFHTASLKKALVALGVDICPHLRFGDPDVLDAFHPGCPRLEGPWSPGNCIQCDSRGPQGVCGVQVNCASCKTRIIFYLSESDDETTTFWAEVSRRIAKSAGSVTDPTWIAYLYMEGDFGRLQEEWQANAMNRPPQDDDEVGGRLEQRWGKVCAGLCITRC